MTDDPICPWCGTYESCHGYDHLARECFPKRIAQLTAERDARVSAELLNIERATCDRIRSENDQLRSILKGAEIALARDEDISGAMRCILSFKAT